MTASIRIEFQGLSNEELDVIQALRDRDAIKASHCPDYPNGPSKLLEETGSGYHIPTRTYDMGWEVA